MSAYHKTEIIKNNEIVPEKEYQTKKQYFKSSETYPG